MASDYARTGADATTIVNRRRGARAPASTAAASVRKISQQPAEAQLSDLSIYGCRIRSPLDHSAGERVWLRFSGSSPIHATVIWCEKGLAGCRFDVPIANALFRALTLDALDPATEVRRIGVQTA